MAALIAEASLDIGDATSVSMVSTGIVLVLGKNEVAIDAARKLGNRMDVSVIISGGAEITPPDVMDLPIFMGNVQSASGHLGAFEVRVENFKPTVPSSKTKLEFTGVGEGGVSTCDLILDLRGDAPLFPAHDKRDGYFKVDPASPGAVAEALFTLTDMTGEFEKPRYIDYDAGICAHSSSQITGCTKCLDVCPTGAIEPNGDKVKYDPYVCAGCGLCAVVCPTGAAKYSLPAGDTLSDRLRSVIGTYTKAGGETPVLLVHDDSFGRDVIAMSARMRCCRIAGLATAYPLAPRRSLAELVSVSKLRLTGRSRCRMSGLLKSVSRRLLPRAVRLTVARLVSRISGNR